MSRLEVVEPDWEPRPRWHNEHLRAQSTRCHRAQSLHYAAPFNTFAAALTSASVAVSSSACRSQLCALIH